ncbi:MAG: hypothetical protein OXH69_17865 [Acidobacteria bacterium]|nr:hypothetical protein [Acidobacteriota bacterium]
MAVCPACDVEIDVDEFDVEQGDELSCSECGANLEVSTVLPVELLLAGDDEDDDLGADEPDDADVDDEPDGYEEDDSDWEA